jgi:hypothetical protein
VESFEPKSAQNEPVLPVVLSLPLPAGLDWRTFRAPEPSWELMTWLTMLTPPGALVVPFGANIAHGSRDYRLDVYQPRGVPCLHLAADPQLPVHGRDEQQQALRERMPAAYWREPNRQAPRVGIAKWQIETAVFRDLIGLSTTQIADDMDFRDDSSRNGSGSRTARGYVQHGRARLAQLGAWPWALEPRNRGRLPRGWHRDERFASALAQWHYRWTSEALRDALGGVEWAAGSTQRSLTDTVADAAEYAYLRVYNTHAQRAQPDR